MNELLNKTNATAGYIIRNLFSDIHYLILGVTMSPDTSLLSLYALDEEFTFCILNEQKFDDYVIESKIDEKLKPALMNLLLKRPCECLKILRKSMNNDVDNENGNTSSKIEILKHSEDYKDRFKAEYAETLERYKKLHKMIVKYDADVLDFTPNCPIELLKDQCAAMGKYLYTLEVRSEVENIDLSDVI